MPDCHGKEAIGSVASTITTVVGARPQFIKAAVVSAALRDIGVSERLLHTGQHHDERMSEVFFEELGLRQPDERLGVHGGRHGEMTARMLAGIEADLLKHPPDLVLVYGDTNSTLAGALAAAKLNIPIAHVEAGLRSYNRAMPEEVNRVLTDHISDWLLCPTSASLENLRQEGVTDGVVHVGDVMFDAAKLALSVASRTSSIVDRLKLDGSEYVVATVHRAENTDDSDRLAQVMAHLDTVAERFRVIMPLHPRTRLAMKAAGVRLHHVEIVEPLGYLDMTALVASAAEVHTDSGGLQKEAYFHGVPCVTLRSETEWVETIEAGWNRLWTTPGYAQRRPISDFGVGDAGMRVAEVVRSA